MTSAPIDEGLLGAWIARVPTIKVDGVAGTVASLRERLSAWWVPDEPMVYIGRTGTNVARRIDDFYRTPLGDPRPHAGGHWLKTLVSLSELRVWWAETDDPDGGEAALLAAFADRHKTGPSLPFANREGAAKARKANGVTGSILPRASQARSAAHATVALTAINDAIQRLACASPDRRVTAVEAASELDRLKLLRDSADRRGLPLRHLLRAGKIDHAYQEGGRWWFIECGAGREVD
jgi:hypothetical protein